MSIQLVKSGNADAIVSAGNTGALMAMSKLILRPMDGITRPAIAAYFPTIVGEKDVKTKDIFIEISRKLNAPLYFVKNTSANFTSDLKGFYQIKNIQTRDSLNKNLILVIVLK